MAPVPPQPSTTWRQELRICLRLAVPLALAQLAQITTGLVDTIMMGQLGREVLAGGSLGAITFTLLLFVCGGVVSAVSPLVAEAYGAGQPERMRQLFWQGLILAVAIAVVTIALVLGVLQALPQLYEQVETLPITRQYFGVMAWSILPAMVFVALRSFVAALGHTRAVMGVMVGGTAINILGNYGLSLGRLGLPALGVRGVALASVGSFTAMVLGLAGYVLLQAPYRSLRLFQARPRICPSLLGELWRVGVPIGGLAVVEGGLFTLITYAMAGFDTEALAAHQIALQTAGTTFMVPLGISMAATVRVGQLLGRGDGATVRRAGIVVLALSAGFMGCTALVLWGFPAAIVALYIDGSTAENQGVLRVAEEFLAVAAFFQIGDGVQVTAAGALRGLKDTRIPFLIGVLAYWGVGLSTGLVLAYPLGLGGVGLWWGMVVGLMAAAVVLGWRFLRLSLKCAAAPVVPASPPAVAKL